MAEEAKGDDRYQPAYCAKRKEIYEEICYDSEYSTLRASVDNARLLRDVDEVARLLRANLHSCSESCLEDQVCECLSVCSKARSYIVNCKDARLHFVDTCTNNRNERNRMEGMIEKFAVLRLRELAQDFDTELGRLSLDIIERRHLLKEAVVEDARGILRSIQEWKLSAVHAFLGRVHASSSIEAEEGFERSDETMMVNWQFARVREVKIPMIGVSLNLGEYHELISACRFDRTVFIKVMRLMKCMHIIGLPLTPYDDAIRLVTPRFGFMIKALKEMSKSELVWSFVRLPSSTCVLVQILLSQSLLNTSTALNFKTSVTEVVKTLDWVLMYEDVINEIDAMSDYDKKLVCLLIRRSKTDQFVPTGLRPTWLGELITRGDYGKIFFAIYRGGNGSHMDKIAEYTTTIDKYANDPRGLERHLNAVVMNNSSRGPSVSHGRTVLELRSESGGCKLIRGKIEVNMGEDKHVRITTSGQFDENVFKEIFLPIDETLVDERIQDDSGGLVDEVSRSIRSLAQKNDISFVNRSGLMFTKPPPISDDNADKMMIVKLVYPRACSTRTTFSLVDDVHWY